MAGVFPPGDAPALATKLRALLGIRCTVQRLKVASRSKGQPSIATTISAQYEQLLLDAVHSLPPIASARCRRNLSPLEKTGAISWSDTSPRSASRRRSQSLLKFSKGYDFKGKTFLDIGCGSGLFSLCAHRLGAQVTSFDVDQDSVGCCHYLHELEGKPATWKITHGSVLDDAFVQSLGHFDYVYSWGVLHHTGAMWHAITNASSRVRDGGALYIAIYNKADGFAFYDDGRFGPSSFWLAEKKIYTALPGFLQTAFDRCVMAAMVALYCVTLQNPWSKRSAATRRCAA